VPSGAGDRLRPPVGAIAKVPKAVSIIGITSVHIACV
jgi:hypothetical protein